MGTFCEAGYSCKVNLDTDVHYCEGSGGATLNAASGTKGAAPATSGSVARPTAPSTVVPTAGGAGASRTIATTALANTVATGGSSTSNSGGSLHSGAANNQRVNVLQLLPFIIGPLAVL